MPILNKTHRDIIPSYSKNDASVKCNSCKKIHLIGDRIMKPSKYGFKDYCPNCKRARTYLEKF